MSKKIIFILLFFYFGFALYALLFSNQIIFPAPKTSYKDSKNIIKLKTNDGETISAIYLKNKKARFTVLYNHGNYEDLGKIFPLLKIWQAHDFSIFAYDYHGYGTSTGHPSEKNAYDDSLTAYHYLTNTLKIPPNKIIAYGKSVGAAMAINIASQKPVAGLILESPFVTAFRVATPIPILPFDKFNNLKKIPDVHCPILIIHGTQDSVIPIWHGKLLYEKANEPKQYFWVENAGHNNLLIVAGDHYWQVIKNFTDKINNH